MPELEKQAEEFTLSSGAGLGVRQELVELPAELARSWSLEYGGIFGGRESCTPTSRLLEFSLSSWAMDGGFARLRTPDNLKATQIIK